MADPVPTAAAPADVIDRLGIRSSRRRRWPDDKILRDAVTDITLPVLNDKGEQDGTVTGTVTDAEALEVMLQLGYRLGWQVTRG